MKKTLWRKLLCSRKCFWNEIFFSETQPEHLCISYFIRKLLWFLEDFASYLWFSCLFVFIDFFGFNNIIILNVFLLNSLSLSVLCAWSSLLNLWMNLRPSVWILWCTEAKVSFFSWTNVQLNPNQHCVTLEVAKQHAGVLWKGLNLSVKMRYVPRKIWSCLLFIY